MLNTSFRLPCGAEIANRLVKAATTERLTASDHLPNDPLVHLYSRWAETQAGILITGNFQIHPKHLESGGNVVADNEEVMPGLKRMARAGKRHGKHIWAQINHAGRQTMRFVNSKPHSASNVQLKKLGLFAQPQPMNEADIEGVIAGFARTAGYVKRAGFTGLQIHAAHGYLLSQFLSPITNLREDRWGGTVENRARLLIEVVRAVRKEVGPGFPISVKLNSADFQRGGFSEDDSFAVVKMLENEGIDLLEISGGTYEKLAFFLLNNEKDAAKLSTSSDRREAYFIGFAERIRSTTKLPLMVTGGFRTRAFCEAALTEGSLDLIGMARPFITNDEEISDFIAGKIERLEDHVLRTGIKAFDDSAEGGYYARQIIRLAHDKQPDTKLRPLWSATFLLKHELGKALKK
ncbi:MAG: NADH:flavin oxidoreductase/NADH oxidase family protein [Bacteroidota bacterium]